SREDDSLAIFSIDASGQLGPRARLPFRGHAIPAGIAFSPDGLRAFVALNGANALAVIDTAARKTIREVETGVAPFGVAVAGGGGAGGWFPPRAGGAQGRGWGQGLGGGGCGVARGPGSRGGPAREGWGWCFRLRVRGGGGGPVPPPPQSRSARMHSRLQSPTP